MVLDELLNRELKLTEDLITDIQKELLDYTDLPEKTLVCEAKVARSFRYYEQETAGGKQTRKALGGADNVKVRRYKRRRFLKDRLKILSRNKKALEYFKKHFEDYSIANIHKHLPSSYKDFPDFCYTDDRFDKLKDWADEEYERNPFPMPSNPNTARDGKQLRSKGECMWYDNILTENIPVRVEPKLRLMGKSGTWYTICPDFLFKCFDGSSLIVEHLGLMDEDQYAADLVRKIQIYLDLGFVIGDNLIITSDNSDKHTNELMIVEALEKIKQRVFGIKVK